MAAPEPLAEHRACVHPAKRAVRVWDLPTRLFHWALVAAVTGGAVTAYVPGSWIVWHSRFGYAVLTLLLFRLVWGFVGGRWSRFRAFLYSPGAVVDYLRGRSHPDHLIGHSPLGAASVFAMLAVLLAQVGSGLVSDDEIAFAGPLNRFVSSANGLAATWYHKAVGQWLLLGLVGLHVVAVMYYLLRRRKNLVRAMVDGDKVVGPDVLPSRDDALSRLAALVVLAGCGMLVYRIAALAV